MPAKQRPNWTILDPGGISHSFQLFERNDGNDGTRTRDLCRDSEQSFGNYLKLRGPDGYQGRVSGPYGTIIGL